MSNSFKTMFYAMKEEKTSISNMEIKKAEQVGEFVANSAAKKLGVLEQVEIDAQIVRKQVEEKYKSLTLKQKRAEEQKCKNQHSGL